jgi:hypothetical protein
MKMHLTLLAAIVAMWSFSASTHAAIMASWLFTGAQNGVDTVPANNGTSNDPNNVGLGNPFKPSSVLANMTASGITAPSAGGAGSTTVRIGALDGTPLGYVGQGNIFLTSSQGVNDPSHVGQYFTVTLTPDPSYWLDFTDLRLQAARSGGSDRGFRVRSSLDGFTADLNPSGLGGTDVMSPANGATQRPTFTNYTIDLAAAAFDHVTTAIEFRFYPWSSAPNNTIDMDNIRFNGTVETPEPASLALLLVSMVSSCGTRLRRLQR